MRIMHEVTVPQKLLENGNIKEPGFARKLIWNYSRNDITAPRARIKEWDYYIITDQKNSLDLTISDCGYIALASCSIVNFEKKKSEKVSSIKPFPMGKLKMPSTSVKGNVSYKSGSTEVIFANDGNVRILDGRFPKFGKEKVDLAFHIKLTDFPTDSMVIATPFDKAGCFYYNQKINAMKASGVVMIGSEKIVFEPKDAFGTLDWGRGVWPYESTWYWCSLSEKLPSGDIIAWNLGCGFGNTSAASENMIFINGKAHKTEDVEFTIPADEAGRDDFMRPWRITSSDNRVELTMEPIYDKAGPVNIGILAMVSHQVFGKFSGYVVLDDNTKINIDGLIGFAEKVHNKW
ncbi:MAG: DUF2804 domain-containing protein [Christensenellaceae bacterium]|jgi:hypothetical protein|nr:DUF2804 domain-containing protein [Christensenellaceae bacterium]